MDNFFPSIEQYFMTETISPRHLWESNCFMDDNIYDFFMAFKYDLDDMPLFCSKVFHDSWQLLRNCHALIQCNRHLIFLIEF